MGNLALAIANAIVDYDLGAVSTMDELYQQLDRDINHIEVKVYREDKSVPLPAYGKDGDACMDIVAKSIEYDLIKDRWIVHTGLHIFLMRLGLLMPVIVENYLLYSNVEMLPLFKKEILLMIYFLIIPEIEFVKFLFVVVKKFIGTKLIISKI